MRGDIDAQIVAINVAQKRVAEMLAEYGLSNLQEIADAIYQASETAALREIRQIPAGIYKGPVECDGWNETIRVVAAVTISDTGITVDYTGSSPQVAYGINESFNHKYGDVLELGLPGAVAWGARLRQRVSREQRAARSNPLPGYRTDRQDGCANVSIHCSTG